MEDDVLWAKMLMSGAKCRNIDDYLVYARTGYDMISRRGGWTYLKKYREGKKKIQHLGFINEAEYLQAMIPQCFIALAPPKIRAWFFTKALRTAKKMK